MSENIRKAIVRIQHRARISISHNRSRRTSNPPAIAAEVIAHAYGRLEACKELLAILDDLQPDPTLLPDNPDAYDYSTSPDLYIRYIANHDYNTSTPVDAAEFGAMKRAARRELIKRLEEGSKANNA